MASVSVELKLGAAVLVTCLAGAMLGSRAAGEIFEGNLEDAAVTTLQAAADGFASHERSEVERLTAALDLLLADDRLREAFVARDRERLLALAAPTFRRLSERDRISHWYFIEPSRAVFLRVHRPELHGDRVERVTLQKAAETRDLGTGKELGQTAFALRAVRPWIHDGELLGYVELAEGIDEFLGALKSRTGDEYGLLVKKKFLDEKAWARVLGPRANTWNDRPDVVVVETTTFADGLIDYAGDIEQIPDGGEALGEAQRGDRAFIRGIFPLRDAADRKVGGLFVLHDFTRQHGALRAAILQAFLVMLAIATIMASAIAVLVHRLVFARLRALRIELEEEAGRAGVPPGRVVAPPSDDELGRIEALFRRVLFPSRSKQDPDGAAQKSAAPRDR